MPMLVLAAAVPAQEQPSVLGPGLVIDESVRQMQGKTVRAIQVYKRDRGAGQLLDAAATESFVRSLQTRVGQPFEQRKVSSDCTNLWNEQRVVVSAQAIEADGEVVISYFVESEVEVYDRVEFPEGLALSAVTRNSLLGLYPDRQVTRTEAEAMRKVLLSRYHRDGYAFCSVTLRELPLGDEAEAAPSAPPVPGRGRVRHRLRFEVDEGPKVTVRNLVFQGNAAYAVDPILGLFGSDSYLQRDARMESDPRRGFISGGAYSREVIEEDLDRLRLFYRSRGYLDATVDLADVAFTPDRSEVDLSFLVVEGPRYRIRSVRVQHVDGNRQPLASPPRHAAADIEQVLKVQAGEFYDHDRLQLDVQAIQDYYGRRGHPPWNYPGMVDVPDAGCRVFPPQEIYTDRPEIDLVFQVSEGVPKQLRDVLIRGNRFTRDHVIRRNIRTLPGDRIDMVEVQKAMRRLQSSRYFQNPVTLQGPRLQLEPVAGQPDYVDLGIDVEDAPTGELRWGIGISTGQGAQASITFNKRNFDLWKPPSSLNPVTAISEILDNKAFHGGGQNLAMLLAPGSRQSQASVTWSDPDIFNEFFDTTELRVSGWRRMRRLPDGYTSDALGAEVGLSHNFTEHLQVGIAARHQTVEVDALAQDATLLAYEAEGNTELRTVRLSARYVDYDDFLRPTEGHEVTASVETTGGVFGGGADLNKFVHTAHLYVPLAENEMGHRTVLHLEHTFGVAEAFGDSNEVFLTERFYVGGNNLRGFRYRGIGPKQFGRAFGGEASYTATAEVFFPLVSTRLEGQIRDRELLRWLVFTDIGLLGLGIDDPTFNQLRGSSGVGIRIEIPMLEIPIAFDIGWPWMHEESDDRQQVWFSISR
ncbi:MAG: BamA/TamA family outer membrane protein [Planctomycetes bacterium]|nr:BamA/TamA family outer membrane protein [Planctomycetota bacterium]